MNKFILVLALLLTPFFSLKISAQNVDSDSVSPKVDYQFCVSGSYANVSFRACDDTAEAAKSKICEGVAAQIPEQSTADGVWPSVTTSSPHCSFDGSTYTLHENTTTQYAPHYDFSCDCMVDGNKLGPTESVLGTVSISNNIEETISKGCPPDDYPDYIIGIDTDDDGEIDECRKTKLENCPDGYLEFKVGGECVPVKCDAAGDSKSIWAKGDLYSNKAGTYCDGSCAYSVSSGQNSNNYSGNISINGVATGDSCGQGTDYSMHEGNDCESVDVGTGTNFMSCASGDTPIETPDKEPPVNIEDEKTQEGDIPEIEPVKEACSPDDTSCEVRNLIEQVKAEGQEAKELDVKMHDKRIEAESKIANTMVSSIKESSQRTSDGLKMVSDAVKGLADSGLGGGGGGSSDGVCDTEGNCSTDIETKTKPSDGLEGFWESEYENGLQGVMDEKLIDIKNTQFFGFLDQFNPSVSGGTATNYNMCFHIGSVADFGCQKFEIDPRTFPAIKIFILVSAGFLCRRILFGG